jgi:P4 family phage/plasmid primase-like protien
MTESWPGKGKKWKRGKAAAPADADRDPPADPGGDGETGGRSSRAPAPNDIAEQILAAHHLVTDDTETVYRYDQGCWREIRKIHLSKLALALEGKYSLARRRNEIVSYIQATTYDPNLKWGRVGATEIAAANGIVDCVNLALRDHAPAHYLERVQPWRFEPGAACPRWMDCLAEWFGDSGEGGEARALQWFFGYVCLGHARFKKALMLYGVPDSGKSLIVHVLTALVGPEQCCTLSVEDMDDPQRRSVIKGMALNVMTELSAEAMIADSGFKTMVSTEDPILLDEKYKAPERYVPTAKHVIATNNLPKLNDRTEATFNRLLIVPMMRSIAREDQDPELPEVLAQEMPGILRWAIEGARELVAAVGGWPEVAAAAEVIAGYRDEINPIGQFLRECCVEEAESAVPLEVMTKSFNRWNAGSRNLGVKQVGGLLRDAGLGGRIKDVRFARGEGKGSRVLKGLIGYELHDTNLPTTLYVRPGAASQPGDTVAGARNRTEAIEADDL